MLASKTFARIQPALSRRATVSVVAAKAQTQPARSRAPSAYNLFFKANYTAVRGGLKKPNLTNAEVLAEVAKAMRAAYDRLSDAERAKYEKEAAELKAKFEADKAAGLIPEKRKRKVKIPGAPKRPANAYGAFTKEMYPVIKAKNPKLAVTEVQKLIAEEWKKVPAAKKQAMAEAYQKQMEQFKKDVEAFNAKQQAATAKPQATATKAQAKKV